jgi:hypothetical protein
VDLGCPTLRGVRSVGTADLDPMFTEEKRVVEKLEELRR